MWNMKVKQYVRVLEGIIWVISTVMSPVREQLTSTSTLSCITYTFKTKLSFEICFCSDLSPLRLYSADLLSSDIKIRVTAVIYNRQAELNHRLKTYLKDLNKNYATYLTWLKSSFNLFPWCSIARVYWSSCTAIHAPKTEERNSIREIREI